VSRACQSLILFFAVVFEVAVSPASEVTKLAPESVVVHLQDGVGSEKVIFFKPNGTSVTKVIATEASGRVSTIPERDIRTTEEPEPDPNLFGVIVHVETHQFVERGLPYKGFLLVFTQDNKPPQQISFIVEDDKTLNLEALQANIDVSVGLWQPDQYRMIIRNSGKTTITKVSISSSSLTDATTGQRILLQNPKTDWGISAIESDQERQLSFELPRPAYAGTFVGQLYVTANEQKTIAVPFTLRSRGPRGKSVLPFVLFCAVLILGFWLSSVLDSWFGGGGLARAQAYLSLKNSQALLVQRYADIQDWKRRLPVYAPPIGVPRAEIWLQQAIQELGAELPSIDQVPQDQLSLDAQRYVLLVGTASLLWSAIQSATRTWGDQPAQLQTTIAALDNVPLPTSSQDFDRYRSALLAAMPVALAAGPAGATSLQVMRVSTQWSPRHVQGRIKTMALLYRSVVWVVVLFTAYQAYYAHNLAFGTLSDYLVLFVWALGLTQTGTQIVARVHK